jgi:hypothetical protein
LLFVDTAATHKSNIQHTLPGGFVIVQKGTRRFGFLFHIITSLNQIYSQAVDMSANEQPEEDTYAAAAPNASNENKWAKNNGFGVTGSVTQQKTGKFSREESEIVRKAVEDFCSMKQITVARLCSECDHKAELKGKYG